MELKFISLLGGLVLFKNKLFRAKQNFKKLRSRKLKEDDIKKWNDKFNQYGFFEFQLKNNIKINLYQDSILSKLIYSGFEELETKFVSRTLKKGDIFIDAGANIGLFSLIASREVGSTGLVIAFEPSPVTFNRLLENIDLNQLTNLDARNVGLSDKEEKLSFHTSQNGYDAWNSFAPSEDDKLDTVLQIHVSKLDFQLKNIDKSKIKLLKIDVEGWEKFVLMGGENFFKEFAPIVMVEFTESNTLNAGYSVLEIYDIMCGWGYNWYEIHKAQLIPSQKKNHYPYENLVAIKN